MDLDTTLYGKMQLSSILSHFGGVKMNRKARTFNLLKRTFLSQLDWMGNSIDDLEGEELDEFEYIFNRYLEDDQDADYEIFNNHLTINLGILGARLSFPISNGMEKFLEVCPKEMADELRAVEN